MQVTNHSNNKRKMKEELLEAIYGTVERGGKHSGLCKC